MTDQPPVGGLSSPTNIAVTILRAGFEISGVALALHTQGIVCLFEGPAGRAGMVPRIGEIVSLRLWPQTSAEGFLVRAVASQRTDLVNGMCTVSFELTGDLLSDSAVAALTERRADPRVKPSPGERLMVHVRVSGGEVTAGVLRDLSMRGFAFDAPNSAEKVLADHAEITVTIALPEGPVADLEASIVNRRDSGNGTLTYGCRFAVNEERRSLPHMLVNFVLRRRRAQPAVGSRSYGTEK